MLDLFVFFSSRRSVAHTGALLNSAVQFSSDYRSIWYKFSNFSPESCDSRDIVLYPQFLSLRRATIAATSTRFSMPATISFYRILKNKFPANMIRHISNFLNIKYVFLFRFQDPTMGVYRWIFASKKFQIASRLSIIRGFTTSGLLAIPDHLF